MFTPEDFPDDSGTFFQFSPFSLHQEDPFLQILPQQLVTDAMGISRESTTLEETMLNKSSDGNGKNGESSSKRLYRKNGKTTPRKRSGKKDRHSKIVTAQGTRDRRMRLSLDIARRFFNLQDMLGFDIASRTVEWLLKQSEEAIHELRKSCIGNTRTGECGEASKTGLGHNGVSKGMTVNKSLSSRDLRVQARARARERTLEKMRIEKGPQYLNQLQSSNTLIPNVVDQSRGGSCSNVRPSTQVLARFSHSPRPQDNLPNFQGIWNDDIAKRFLDSEGNVELHKGFTDKLKSVKGSSQSLSFSCLSNAQSSFRATTSSPFPWNQ